jgi:uncharacterized protein involved in response to NO
MTLAGVLPPALVTAIDLPFVPLVAWVVARPIVAARQARNLGFPAVLVVLSLANLATHLDALGVTQGAAPTGLRLGVTLICVLVVVVGGRITPAFTANALRRTGSAAVVRSRTWADRLAVAAVVAFAGTDVLAPRSALSGAVALLAAAAVLVRMSSWQSLRTGSDPLLWSLHLGYAWIAVGLALLGVSDLSGALPWTSGLHALTAGAFGTMIIAVMTRVGLGHAGRPLVVPSGIVAAYVLVSAGALLRVAGPLLAPQLGSSTISASGLLWSAGFVVFTVRYWPILTRPRNEGQPG